MQLISKSTGSVAGMKNEQTMLQKCVMNSEEDGVVVILDFFKYLIYIFSLCSLIMFLLRLNMIYLNGTVLSFPRNSYTA